MLTYVATLPAWAYTRPVQFTNPPPNARMAYIVLGLLYVGLGSVNFSLHHLWTCAAFVLIGFVWILISLREPHDAITELSLLAKTAPPRKLF